jgi:hypothetical protein
MATVSIPDGDNTFSSWLEFEASNLKSACCTITQEGIKQNRMDHLGRVFGKLGQCRDGTSMKNVRFDKANSNP